MVIQRPDSVFSCEHQHASHRKHHRIEAWEQMRFIYHLYHRQCRRQRGGRETEVIIVIEAGSISVCTSVSAQNLSPIIDLGSGRCM